MDFHKPMYLIVADLETMGTKPGCIVTEIGAVAIEVNKMKSLSFSYDETLDYTSSKRAGFKADKRTMDWWAKQLSLMGSNRIEFERVFASRWRNTRSIKKSIATFTEFYEDVVEAADGDKNQVLLVGNDIDFDKSILEHYYIATNSPIPWHYRAWLSLPTLVWLVEFMTGINVKNRVRDYWTTTHIALDDARQEVAMVNTALDLMRGLMYTETSNVAEEE